MVKQLPNLTEGQLNSKKEIVKNFLRKSLNNYYMLLCNEQKDYTVFRITNNEEKDRDEQKQEIVNILIDECLPNRGGIRGIDLTEQQDAVEIWLYIDEEAYVYYFFPYDEAVIEV